MRPRRVSPWPRVSVRGFFESRQRSHGSHAFVNPYPVRHFEIPPNSRMNRKTPGGIEKLKRQLQAALPKKYRHAS